MEYYNNNSNNNNPKQMRELGGKPTIATKPDVPSKPAHLKPSKPEAAKEAKYEASEKEKTASVSQPEPKKGLSRMGSLDHVTPKVWSHPQPTKVHEKDLSSVPELPSTNELPKSRFSNKWRPAPRLQPQLNKKKHSSANQNEDPAKPTVSSEATAEAEQSSRKAIVKPGALQINVETEDGRLEGGSPDVTVSPVSSTSSLTDSSLLKPHSKDSAKIQQRPSFLRDPKSPGFGTLKRMWNTKANQPENFSPKPYSATRRTGDSDRCKPRASTVTLGGAAWQHVNSPLNLKQSSGSANIGDATDNSIRHRSASVDFLSPKPFRSSSISDENLCIIGELDNDSKFTFNGRGSDTNQYYNYTDNLHDVETNSNVSSTFASDDKHLDQCVEEKASLSADCDEETVEKNASLNADVGIYESLPDKDDSANLPTTTEHEVAVYNEGTFDENDETITPAIYDVAADYSTDEDMKDDPPSPPQVPAHGYLPMTALHVPVTTEIRYEQMSQGAEVNEISYSSQVPPPPKNLTKSKREYHEIDPDVPPPPNREPPRLSHGLKSRPSQEPPPIPQEEDEIDEPPPLPPDNTVGRRSMMYTKEKKLQVVRGLQNNMPNTAGQGKKLNYIEVEVTSNGTARSNKSSPMSQRKTNYSDVIVVSDNDIQQRDQSGSVTSEEGIASAGTKKQKNVKNKLQSLFTKEEPRPSNKESQETTTDFEKERNKKKRISGRFMKKKKDPNKNKSDRLSDSNISRSFGSDSGSLDYESSSTSLEASRSTSAITTSSSSSHSSGDGEVTKVAQSVTPQMYGDHSENARWKVLPTHDIAERRKSDHTMGPSPPIPQPRSNRTYVKSMSSGHMESTFVAYPVDANPQPLMRTKSGDTIEYEEDSTPKVSSFLHGASNPTRCKTRSEPSPSHNRLSAPLPLNGDGSSPRPLPRVPLSQPQPHLTQSPRTSNSFVPMPGMVSASPKPYPGDPTSPASPAPPRLAKPSEMKEQLTLDPPSIRQPSYSEAVDGAGGVYDVAEEAPPPLPERDESFYEGIDATYQVPPSPFPKDDSQSKFLQSEPLYQIYRNRTMSHASAKRHIANNIREKAQANSGEANSEGEWKSDFMSDDLGTSTLWRLLPEVESSGIAENMSTEQLKLQQSQFEVITSQASYLRSLNILVDHFMRDWAMESTDVLPITDRHHLFSNIETVCACERRFLQDLEKHFWKDLKLTRVCDLVAQYAKNDFSVYVLYIQNQVYQDRVLTKLQRNHERFSEELCRLESSPECNKLPLLSFLMLPMQRVTRLPLLVSAVVNAADAAGDMIMVKKAKHTLGVVNKLVKKCNEGARKMQQTEQLAEIASQLDYSSSVKMYALVSQSRSLVKKGEMNVSIATDSKKAGKTSKLWLFLFSDVLFIAKKKSYIDLAGSSPRFEVIDWANRQFLAVNERAVTENAIFLVVLENQAGKRLEMSLMPLAQNELSRWTNALNPPSLGITGESIYEAWDCPQYSCIYPHVAQQPDELSIDVGDVMQVMKKTSDGWLEGERLRDGECGWFPSQNCEEIEDEHVRSRNMKNLYRTYIS